jgi:hypothetical protein
MLFERFLKETIIFFEKICTIVQFEQFFIKNINLVRTRKNY